MKRPAPGSRLKKFRKMEEELIKEIVEELEIKWQKKKGSSKFSEYATKENLKKFQPRIKKIADRSISSYKKKRSKSMAPSFLQNFEERRTQVNSKLFGPSTKKEILRAMHPQSKLLIKDNKEDFNPNIYRKELEEQKIMRIAPGEKEMILRKKPKFLKAYSTGPLYPRHYLYVIFFKFRIEM